MGNNKFKDKIELLEIELKHLKNDYLLTKKENEGSTRKYLEILFELKEKNKNLEDLQKNLEKKVEERTKVLNEAHAELEQMMLHSEKMASIGTIAAGVAHEINNPMGYIYSNLMTLLKYNEKLRNFSNDIQKLINEHLKVSTHKESNLLNKFIKLKNDGNIDFLITDMKDAVEESVEGSEKIKRIVLDLRDFSRDDAPKFELNDINEGMEKTLNVIWNELKYKAEVIKEFGDIPKVECDIQRLSQVFMNILINAAQAIEKNGTIKIKTFSADNSVVIQISDTGKGIPKENIGKIFNAFYTTKDPGKGTGLGLSISYKIIEEHNGIIEVESEVGKGTTFIIKLPARKFEQIKEYKILIVDDENNIREAFKRMIHTYNSLLLVRAAKDGFEAGDLLHSFKPDVVLMDIYIPGMNGIEVCEKIRADKKMKNTKVIMMTGFYTEDLKKKSFEAGAVEFLTKPICEKTLYKVLDKIIKG